MRTHRGKVYTDIHGESGKPLLHRLWLNASIIAWSVFVIFQILIGVDKFISAVPICPNSDNDFPAWYTNSYIAILTGFAVVLLTMIGKIAQSEHSNDLPSYLLYFNIVAISTAATFMSLCFQWGGVCKDSLGVTSPAAMWGEWFSCGPLLLLSVLGAQDKRHLSQVDCILLVMFTFNLVSGFCINFTKTVAAGQAVLILSIVSYAPFFFLPLFLRINMEESFGSALSYKKKRYLLTLTFILGMPLFGVTYLMAASNVIDAAVTILTFQFLSLAIKALYAAVLMDLYQSALIATQDALDRERAANESRRNFLKYLFHEVRSPLNSLSIGIEILERSAPTLGEEANESLQMMRGASEFMASTLNDVLSMQKIEEGKMELEMHPFALTDAVTKVFSTFRGAAIAKALRLRPNLAHDIPFRIVGDRFRIEHVLANLLSNAIKFSPHGGVVTVSATKVEEYTSNGTNIAMITISVKDEGPGIPQDHQEKLFGEYVQIEAAVMQQGGGSGLGLSLCKQIVSLHNGTIGVRSELGQGSTFYFSIPFEVLHPSRTASPGGTFHDYRSAPHDNRPTTASEIEAITLAIPPVTATAITLSTSNEMGPVLVVDDTESNRKMMKLLLRNCGISAEVADNGQTAVAMVLEDINKFSIIFMDDSMPIMKGSAATNVIRRNGFDNLIIGVSGNVLDDDVEAFLSSGADMVLHKPLRMSSLQLVLKHVKENGFQSQPGKTLVEHGGRLVWMQNEV